MTIVASIDVDTIFRDMTGGESGAVSAGDIGASLDIWLPHILEYFAGREMKCTFFMVADDVRHNSSWAQRIVAAGHEVASHSLTHPKQLSSLRRVEIRKEVADSRAILEDACGCAVEGFRAPGYTLSNSIVEELERAGYVYDASLNMSASYNLLKRCVKLALPTPWVSYIAVEKIRWRPLPTTFRPARRDYSRPAEPGEAASSIVEVPIALSSFVRWPLATSLYHALPAPVTKLFVKNCYRSPSFTAVELHDWEFGDAEDYKRLHGRSGDLSLYRFAGSHSREKAQNVISRVLDAAMKGQSPTSREPASRAPTSRVPRYLTIREAIREFPPVSRVAIRSISIVHDFQV